MINDWQLLTIPSLADLGQARSQCHQAIQNVATIGRSFLAKSLSDEYAYLTWDDTLQRLVGRWVKGNITFRSSISIKNFEVYLVDERFNTLSAKSMDGITQTDVMVWLEQEMSHLGVDFSKLNLAYPYEIPAYPTAKKEPFQMASPQAFETFSRLYHNTNFVLNRILEEIENVSGIKCWPHHFDIATTVILLDTGDPKTSRSIRLGMSPGDQYYDEPYFYVSPWPYPMKGLIDLDHLKAHWHQEDWVGAVKPVRTLSAHFLIQDQRKIVIDFFQTVFQHLKGSL